MTDVAGAAPNQAVGGKRASVGEMLRATEIDLRLFGMVVALVLIWIGLGLANSSILQPVNFLTFSVQAAGTAILATGMVLVIVSRNIDLSVGSVVGFIGMSYAFLMANVFPTTIGVNHPLAWVIALAFGVLLGIVIGGFQGFLIAYLEIPSFVVTLGGLFLFRGLIWQLSGGTTIAPDDPTFVLIGGGPEGSLGGTLSWVFGIVISLAAVYLLVNARRQRHRFGFPLRPMWAEVLIGVVAIAVVLGGVYVANSYLWPAGLASQYAAKHGITEPAGGLQIAACIPFPLVILIAVTIVMT